MSLDRFDFSNDESIDRRWHPPSPLEETSQFSRSMALADKTMGNR